MAGFERVEQRAGHNGLDGFGAEGVEPDLAGAIGAVGREEAGLEAEKAQGVVGAHRAAADRAGVAVESARQVERQARAGQGVDGGDPARVLAGHVAHEAGAVEAVDDQAEIH